MKSIPLRCPSSLRNRHKPLALLVLAGCSWSELTLAQDPAAPASAPGDATAPTTASSADTSAEKPRDPFRTGTSSRTGSGSKKSPFAYNTGDTEPAQTRGARKVTDADAEPEKAAGAGSSEADAPRFVAPGFYGRAPQVVTPGQGQYARPKFRYGISVGVGFDDNPDQTPSVSASAVARPRNRSGFNWVNGHWDAQWLKPRTVFTVNLEAGADFY